MQNSLNKFRFVFIHVIVMQDELIENLEFRTKRITSTDNLLADAEKFYTDLKQQYKEIETLLSESGYQPSPESTQQ